MEKLSFSLKFLSGDFYGQSFMETVRGPLTYLPNLGPLGVIGRDLISDCAISGHLVLKRQAIKCAGHYNKSQSFLTRPKSDMCAQ